MAMHNPPHPGGIIRRQCLEALDLSVTETAKGLGVTRQALSDLINGKAGFRLIWQFVYRRHSAQAQRRGSVCKWLMIFGGRASVYARYGFGISRPLSGLSTGRLPRLYLLPGFLF